MEKQMGIEAFNEIMRTHRNDMLPASHPTSRYVAKVAKRIVESSQLQGDWEVHVIVSPTANAFVIPGGKIFVFTGILPVVDNEDGMAAVLGHEIVGFW
jgi:metalloendopeptidase OMA1, mitochondrial